MLCDGFIEEARNLHTKGITKATNLIGYKELFLYFDKKMELRDSVETTKARTRKYAKRQYTWINNQFKNVKWFNVNYENIDETIKKIADCGGAVGINFCSDFLGGPAYESVYDHLSHLLKVGGEDVVAIGSDFDGIPVTEGLENCLKVGELLEYLSKRKVSGRILEKFAFSNFMRVFSCVRP